LAKFHDEQNREHYCFLKTVAFSKLSLLASDLLPNDWSILFLCRCFSPYHIILQVRLFSDSAVFFGGNDEIFFDFRWLGGQVLSVERDGFLHTFILQNSVGVKMWLGATSALRCSGI